jgi:hypothetical protein
MLFAWSSLNAKQDTIDKLTKTRDRLTKNNGGDDRRPGVDQIIGEVGTIDQWKLRDINWLGELKQLSDRMLTPDDIIVDSLTASAGRGMPRIDMKSRLASIKKENELVSSLRTRPYSPSLKRSEEGSDKDYPLGRDLSVSYDPDLDALVQQVTLQAAEFLQKQQQEQQEQQQQQAITAEEPK